MKAFDAAIACRSRCGMLLPVRIPLLKNYIETIPLLSQRNGETSDKPFRQQFINLLQHQHDKSCKHTHASFPHLTNTPSESRSVAFIIFYTRNTEAHARFALASSMIFSHSKLTDLIVFLAFVFDKHCNPRYGNDSQA